MTGTSKEDDVALKQISCNHYSIWFKKNKVQVLIDLGSEINIMTLAYISKLGF